MLYIIDNVGKTIKVTDFDKAIIQAKTFLCYRHKNRGYTQFDRQRHVYWKDIYLKLIHTSRPEASLFYFQIKTRSRKNSWKNIEAVPLLLSDADTARAVAHRAAQLYKARVRLTINNAQKVVGKGIQLPL